MGDGADYSDVGRVLRSPEGQRALDKFRQSVLGKVIGDVTFCQLSTGISVTLHFVDGEHLDLNIVQQAFSIESLRDRYPRVLQREFDKDFPERKGPR